METQTATETKERPIIFSSAMVKAILEGRKAQTRRVIKLRNDSIVDLFDDDDLAIHGFCGFDTEEYHGRGVRCPYGKVGDKLWVRETWAEFSGIEPKIEYVYKMDGLFDTPAKEHLLGNKWNSPIFMPREASRITLEITDIRVERLQDISLDDIEAEGIQLCCRPSEKSEGFGLEYYDRKDFRDLWNKINGKKYPFSSNPFVWVISFKKI
jgi:hypothetical protein